MSITAAVVGLAALNYFTLQTQLNSMNTATSICQAVRNDLILTINVTITSTIVIIYKKQYSVLHLFTDYIYYKF
jgi:hypothetical protein